MINILRLIIATNDIFTFLCSLLLFNLTNDDFFIFQGGLWFDNRLSYGQIDMNKWVPENGKLGLNMYTPSDPPNANGTLVEAYMSG